MKKYFGGIFFIAMSTLALEIAVIRYFSIALWSNYGYMVISIALFGFGVSGTLLTLAKNWFEKRINLWMYIISLSAVPLAVLAYILMKKVPFNAMQIVNPSYTFTQLSNLALYFIILFFPFFFGGIYIGLAFIAHKKQVSKLYFFDLIGAGTGTLILLILMFIIPPAYLILPIIVFFFSGHILSIDYREIKKNIYIKMGISALVFAVSLVTISFNTKIEYVPQKSIRHTMSSINAKILATRYSPLGLLQIVKSTKERSAPGLSGMSYQMIGKMPDFLGVYVDGNQSSSVMAKLNGSTIDAVKYLPQVAPYLIKDKPGVLILGMGGARSLSVAYHAVRSMNFLDCLKDVWIKENIKIKLKELRKTYKHLNDELYEKHILKHNKTRIENEVNNEWNKVIKDEINRMEKLKPFLNKAYQLTVRKYENKMPSYIHAVELSGQLVELLKNQFSKFNGGILSKGGVRAFQADVRGYLRKSKQKYDIIEMSLALGGGMSSGGNLPSHENYLYTIHSIRDAFARLKKNGILSMTVDAKENLRDALRVFTTSIKALENMKNLKKKFFMFRTMTTATFLIKNGDFTANEIKKLTEFCKNNSFDASYYLGIDPNGNREIFNQEQGENFNVAETKVGPPGQMPVVTEKKEKDKNNILRYSLYKIAISKFVKGGYKEFIEKYPFKIGYVTDNNPYFSYRLKLSKTLKVLFTGKFSEVPYEETNYLILWLNFALAIFFGALIICIPLLKTLFNKKKEEAVSGGKLVLIGYFVCLGFGFLFVEMVLIQKLTLFLANPIYSTSLVLATILAVSGIGSYFSGKLSEKLGSSSKVLLLAVSIIAVMVVLYIFILDPIVRSLMFLPMAVKLIIAMVFIAPIAFFLGMPFPLGLHEVSEKREDFLPWAWGINGATSVASTPLATILSIGMGFKGVWVISILVYALAFFIFPGRLTLKKNKFILNMKL